MHAYLVLFGCVNVAMGRARTQLLRESVFLGNDFSGGEGQRDCVADGVSLCNIKGMYMAPNTWTTEVRKYYYGMTPDRIHGSVQSAPFICGP